MHDHQGQIKKKNLGQSHFYMHHTKSKQDSYFGEFRPPFFGKYWVRVVKFTPCVGSHMYYIFIMGRHMLSWHSSSPSQNSLLLVHLL